MNFPIAGLHINTLFLIGVGFVVGLLGGFFGVGGSFLAGAEVNAVVRPGQKVGVFIEFGSDDARLAAIDIGDGDVAIGPEEERIAVRGHVGDLLAVG